MAMSLRRIQEITQHFCHFPNVWPRSEAFHFVIPVVTSGSTMYQNVSVRRTRGEVSSTHTYATVGPDEKEDLFGSNVGNVPTEP